MTVNFVYAGSRSGATRFTAPGHRPGRLAKRRRPSAYEARMHHAPWRYTEGRLLPSICASLALHGLAIGLVLRLGQFPSSEPDLAPLLVFIGPPGPRGGVGALSGTGQPRLHSPAPRGSLPKAEPPKAERVTVPSRSETVAAIPPPSVERMVTSEPGVAPPAAPAPPVVKTTRSVPVAPAALAAPTQVASVGRDGGGGGASSLGAPGGAGGTAAYEQVLAAWLDRHKYYPTSLRRRGIEGEGKLRVTIARSGRLLGVDVDSGFSHPTLADVSREWVRRAEPFPPVPESMAGEDFVFVVPVAFRLQ